MSETNRRASLLSRLGRWLAELVLVFVGVYAAFWLNNYQEHREEAGRRDQILASFEEQLRQGIESGKTNRAKQEKKPRSFGVGSTPVKCRHYSRLFSPPITAQL